VAGGFDGPDAETIWRVSACCPVVRVSVVLCTYSLDMFEHFRDAAESVLSQSYGDVELVVVVDGTEAVYERVVEEYGDHEDVVVHCNEENVGLLESRNTGAELASGDVVAFIDDDAVADEEWVAELVESYEGQEALAVGGKMVGEWVAGKPSFLPEEFYWLVGVTHRGFADGPGWVRNTFGSNISFDREVFLDLDGFDTEIGGRQGDANLQGGETELCARLDSEYGEQVWYNPEAVVAHKVFEYRTEFWWLVDRAFWQGYSKRAMETLVAESTNEESEFVSKLLTEFFPARLRDFVTDVSKKSFLQIILLFVLTGLVGCGYCYGAIKY
jgi:glycosyltransferase involved in cell wall biosynthesis